MNIGQICTTLKTRYNTKCLDSLDHKLQSHIYDICSYVVKWVQQMDYKYNDNIKRILETCNYPLIKLIYNKYKGYEHDFGEPPIFDNLLGPCSITLYQSEKYKKTIYVIGEFHCARDRTGSAYESCQPKHHASNIDIANFLSYLAQNTSVFLDFYLEIPSRIKNSAHSLTDGFMGEIAEKNIRCFNDETFSNKVYPNCATSRWHYTDSRFDHTYRQTSFIGHFYYDIHNFIKNIKNSNKTLNLYQFREKFIELFDYIVTNKKLQKIIDTHPNLVGKDLNLQRISKGGWRPYDRTKLHGLLSTFRY